MAGAGTGLSESHEMGRSGLSDRMWADLGWSRGCSDLIGVGKSVGERAEAVRARFVGNGWLRGRVGSSGLSDRSGRAGSGCDMSDVGGAVRGARWAVTACRVDMFGYGPGLVRQNYTIARFM